MPTDSLDFPKLRAAEVANDPFGHILVPHFVRPENLSAIVADLPAIKARGSFPIEAVKLGPKAKALFAALQGPEFRAIIAGKFNLDLGDAPVMSTLRGNSGIKDGQIHTDSSAKRVTILLYLNPSDPADENAWTSQSGALRLLRNGHDLEDYVTEIPPVDGALLVFPNGPATWHGHKPFTGQRYVVQMNYMTTGTKAKAEMRRHHVSAFFKRLTRAV